MTYYQRGDRVKVKNARDKRAREGIILRYGEHARTHEEGYFVSVGHYAARGRGYVTQSVFYRPSEILGPVE